MKRSNFLYISILFLFPILFTSCAKETSYSLQGVVRNYITKMPIANCDVRIDASGPFLSLYPHVYTSTTTDSLGNFSIDFSAYYIPYLRVDKVMLDGINKFRIFRVVESGIPDNRFNYYTEVSNNVNINILDYKVTKSKKNLVIEVQPYIYIRVLLDEEQLSKIKSIHFPELSLKLENMTSATELVMYLEKFNGNLEYIVEYFDDTVENKLMSYDYLDNYNYVIKM